MSWIQSYSGNVIDVLDPNPAEIRWADIPHALAQKVRFQGHTQEAGYTVAQHCVLGARAIEEPFKLAFLLHELSEVYLPDVPTPIKRLLNVCRLPQYPTMGESWAALETRHTRAALAYLAPALPCSAQEMWFRVNTSSVLAMDRRMLLTEVRDLMGPPPQPWGTKVEPLEQRIVNVWSYQRARYEFQDLAEELMPGLRRSGL